MNHLFNRLPPVLKDALTGLGYALIITILAILSGGDHELFRYLKL